MSSELQQLRELWVAAWPSALAAWSRHVQLRRPTLCLHTEEAVHEGLTESFAMIRLNDQSVVVNLEDVQRSGLEAFAVEILAHEIGHHVLAPANLTDHARCLARMRKALPTLEAHAPMVANLYTDLLINDRLQRSAELRMSAVFKQLTSRKESSGGSPAWRVYLRMYELLWSLPAGELTGVDKLSGRMEGDAWLGMRIVRHYSRDWLRGAGSFATLLLQYLAEEALTDQEARAWHDTKSAGRGGEPSGLTEADPEEGDIILHPSQNPELSGEELTAPAQAPQGEAPSRTAGGQARQPFEFGEILKAAGVQLSDFELAVRYYREKAHPHLVRFPERPKPKTADVLPEGLEPWSIGEPFDTVDWMQSIFTSPRIVPGMTTMQRMWGLDEAPDPKGVPLDLDVYIDSSGSMSNPQQLLSYPTLAGAILCLSALRAGASVQVVVWSGKAQYYATPGFVRNQQEVLNTLVAYIGGGTQFPLHILRETYLSATPHRRPTHLLVISDDGVTTMFDKDERGKDGYELLRAAMIAADGGATFVLNMHPTWRTASRFVNMDRLLAAEQELGVNIQTIADWSELVAFARSFAHRTYN